MNRRSFRLLGLLLLVAHTAHAGDVLLDDFNRSAATNGWTILQLAGETAAVAADDTLSGGQALELRGTGKAGAILRPVVARDWRSFSTLTFYAMAEAAAPLELRVLALEPSGTRGLQRRVTLPPGGWREVRLPLASFRWNNDTVGDFGRVGRLALRWEQGAGTLRLDDVRLQTGKRGLASARPALAERLRLAFPDGDNRLFEGRHFALLTDAPELFGENGRKLLDRLEQALRVLQFHYALDGDIVEKIPFFVFKTREAYRAYFPRLGGQYRATIAAPASDGFSVLDVAASYYSPVLGWDRPVFVHEAIHLAVCQLLRLPTNNNWIQEMLAASVQASLHPHSISRLGLAQDFARLAGGRAGRFMPWAQLLARPPTPDRYAELVTILDFIQDQHLADLPKIWRAIRALDQPAGVAALPAIAGVLKQTPSELERRWLAWGERYYVPK